MAIQFGSGNDGGDGGEWRSERPPSIPGGGFGVTLGLAPILALVIGAGVFMWMHCRIQVDKGHIVMLMKKTGKDLSNDMVLAPDSSHKGPQFDILKEGRHFKNPYFWQWSRPQPAIVIPKGKVGIKVRRYGKQLAAEQVVAASAEHKGIAPEPITPGRHYINTWAYDIYTVDMVKIEPGFMGIVTLLVGDAPEDANVFVVREGERGTQPELLMPGTHPRYSNPYVYKVTPFDVRSHKFEMGGDYRVIFPSKDGWEITVEGTIEWAVETKMLPELFVKYVDASDLKASGGMMNVQRKLILPFARSFFRTVGGRHKAVDYITGTTRVEVQRQVESSLADACAKEGVIIRSFVIKSTVPPDEIRKQYQRREIALRDMDRFGQEIITEIGNVVGDPILNGQGKQKLDPAGEPMVKPHLDEDGKPMREGGRLAQALEERKKDRESQLGDVRADIAEKLREAEEYSKVEVTKASRERDVAEINLKAAQDRAEAKIATGLAAAYVMDVNNRAEAAGVAAKVEAFGGQGEEYAQFELISKLAPRVRSYQGNTDGESASWINRYLSPGKLVPASEAQNKAAK